MPEQFQQLLTTIAHLRGPNGCPWDKAQTLESMRPHLLEECYEVLEVLDNFTAKPETIELTVEELGDLLFVLLLIVQIGEDHHHFTLTDVCQQINDKMISRHAHLFSNNEAAEQSPQELNLSWERSKRTTVKRKSRLDGIPPLLPALSVAARQGEKAAAVGFDWPTLTGVINKVKEEWDELSAAIQAQDKKEITHELGDLLMSIASLGRHLEAPAEEALRVANGRFKERFITMEKLASTQGLCLDELDDLALDALWEEAKSALS